MFTLGLQVRLPEDPLFADSVGSNTVVPPDFYSLLAIPLA